MHTLNFPGFCTATNPVGWLGFLDNDPFLFHLINFFLKLCFEWYWHASGSVLHWSDIWIHLYVIFPREETETSEHIFEISHKFVKREGFVLFTV